MTNTKEASGDVPPLDVRWIHGSPPGGPPDPPIQVHKVDADTFIMRQSKDVTFEAPFLFLLRGRERALLLDSGAVSGAGTPRAGTPRAGTPPEGTGTPRAGTPPEGTVPEGTVPEGTVPEGTVPEGTVPEGTVRATVDALLADRGPGYELVVAHTHGHGDHVAGDDLFGGRPGTTVVPRDAESVREFFGFTSWPDEIVTLDLGSRALLVTGSPGHHAAAITVYDPLTRFLFTGDTVLPGRLYVQDMPAFAASLDRLAEFAATHPVSHVLGCHIEMSGENGRDYPIWCRYQPDEPPLEMTVAQLLAVRDAAHAVAARPGAHDFGGFVIYNGMRTPAVARLLARGMLWRLRARLRGRRA